MNMMMMMMMMNMMVMNKRHKEFNEGCWENIPETTRKVRQNSDILHLFVAISFHEIIFNEI